MNLTRDAATSVVAAKAAYRLFLANVRTSEGKRYRKFVQQSVVIEAGMSMMKSKAIAACRSIGLTDERIQAAIDKEVTRHFTRGIGGRTSKEDVKKIAESPEPTSAAPLG